MNKNKDFNTILHDKRQNELSFVLRDSYNDIRRDLYKMNHLTLTHMTGCYCYDFYNMENNIDIINTDTEGCKYWVIYDDHIYLRNDLDLSKVFPLNLPTEMTVKQFYYGRPRYPRMLDYARLIRKCNDQLNENEDLVVYFPYNEEMMSYKAYIRFVEKFKKVMFSKTVKIAMENLESVKVFTKKTLFFVVDVVTSFERQTQIVNEIKEKTDGLGYICFFTYLKVLNYDEANYLISNNNQIKLYLEQEEKKLGVSRISQEKKSLFDKYDDFDDYNEEEAIMRALSGKGADPELWGY